MQTICSRIAVCFHCSSTCSHSMEIKSHKRDNDVPAGCQISMTGTGSTFCHFGSGSPCTSSSELMMDLPFRFAFALHSFCLEMSHATFHFWHTPHDAFPSSWMQGSPRDMQAPQGPLQTPPAFPCSEKVLTYIFLPFRNTYLGHLSPDQPYVHWRGGRTTYI